MSITKITAPKQTREELIAQTIAETKESLTEYEAALATLKGDGAWVVFTGKRECPVFVTFNENMTGVLPSIGVRRATRFVLHAAAVRMAGKVRNGNNELGDVMHERDAYEEMIGAMKILLDMFQPEAA